MGKRRKVSRKSVFYSGDRKVAGGAGPRHMTVTVLTVNGSQCCGSLAFPLAQPLCLKPFSRTVSVTLRTPS